MAITLAKETLPARTTYHGNASVSATAGQHVVVETSPQGEELLDAVVPAGKTWVVTVNIYIQES